MTATTALQTNGEKMQSTWHFQTPILCFCSLSIWESFCLISYVHQTVMLCSINQLSKLRLISRKNLASYWGSFPLRLLNPYLTNRGEALYQHISKHTAGLGFSNYNYNTFRLVLMRSLFSRKLLCSFQLSYTRTCSCNYWNWDHLSLSSAPMP